MVKNAVVKVVKCFVCYKYRLIAFQQTLIVIKWQCAYLWIHYSPELCCCCFFVPLFYLYFCVFVQLCLIWMLFMLPIRKMIKQWRSSEYMEEDQSKGPKKWIKWNFRFWKSWASKVGKYYFDDDYYHYCESDLD